MMQNQSNAGKQQKKKRELVYKPFLKGKMMEPSVLKKGLKILGYYAIFVFVFLVVGGMIGTETHWLAWTLNLILVGFCGALLYVEGSREGEAQVALGEIAYSRIESGKEVETKDRERCYHPLKGWMTMLLGASVVVLLAAVSAILAKKQVYALQSLPEWVSSYDSDSEVMKPLAYYQASSGMGFPEIMRMIGRLLIFPFAQVARLYGSDALLLADRLGPLLVCLPALGYPLGYLTGPRSRAMVHGDIKTSRKNYQRRQRKAMKARRQRTEKKNELI